MKIRQFPLVAGIVFLALSLNAELSPTARTGRFSRGSGEDPTYQSFVIPLDFQKGLSEALSFQGTTFYHLDATNTASQTNISARLPFNSVLASFGSQNGGSPLYIDQPYRFGVYSGNLRPSGSLSARTNGIIIDVYDKATMNYVNSFAMSVPSPLVTNEWNTFLTNGLAFSVENYGLKTTYFESGNQAWGTHSDVTFVLTHKATTNAANYLFMVWARGATDKGDMILASNGGSYWCPLYSIDFDQRPATQAIFLDQPHFDGEPLPSGYLGKSIDELLSVSASVTNAVSATATNWLTLDDSPELLRHPVLDQFVADMGSNALALANYVFNEIQLSDAISYNDNGKLQEKSINLGGVNRSALGTFMEKQGSPMEQSALLIYLLRQAGVPAAYIFPPDNGIKMLDKQLSKLLRMQIKGAVNEKGDVYDGNLAFGKSATQSSTNTVGTTTTAGRAVDGNKSGLWNDFSVSCTESNAQAWWQVDLGTTNPIGNIELWNRTDAVQSRLSNVYILVSEAPFTSTNLTTTLSQSGVSNYFVSSLANQPSISVPVNRSGRYVRIQLAGTNLLQLAEVRVLQPESPLISVNYPWVAAYVNNQWVHLFPWLKDTELVEGLNLYDYMPTNYNSGYKWTRQYLYGDTNILSLSTETDLPSVLFPKFVEKVLLTNAPGVSLEDIGTHAVDRRHLYASWNNFPRPFWVTTGTVITAQTLTTVTNALPSLTNLFNTLSVEVFCNNATNKKVFSGDLRCSDLHNRQFLIRHETNGANYDLVLTLAPYRPDQTNTVTAFTNDAALLNKELMKVTLHSTNDALTIRMVHKRRALPVGVQTNDHWNAYLGYTEEVQRTDDYAFRKGDLAAVCLNAGRVTKEMVSVHAQEYWKMQRDVLATPSLTNSLSPDIYQGTLPCLMGMAYYERISRFMETAEALHKKHVVSSYSIGLSKLGASRTAGNVLATPLQLVQPNVDMHFKLIAHANNGMLRPDSGDDYYNAQGDFLDLAISEVSAQEHATVEDFYGQNGAISTVSALRQAQKPGQPGMLLLTKTNYLAYRTSNPSLTNDLALWKDVTNALTSLGGDYTVAFVTAAPITNSAAAYRGMAAMVIGPDANAALISGNGFVQNGGWGVPLNTPIYSPPSIVNNSLSFNNSGTWSVSYSAPTISTPKALNNVTANWDISSVASGISAGTISFGGVNTTQSQLFNTASSYLNISTPDVFGNTINYGGGYRSTVGETFTQFGSAVIDPVNAVTGEFYVDTTDISLPGPMPLVVRRCYSSQNMDLGEVRFGYGWRPSYQPYLRLTDTNIIYAAEMDGTVIAYRQTGAGTNSWKPLASDNPLLNNHSQAGIGSTVNLFNNWITNVIGGGQTNYYLYGSDGSRRRFRVQSFSLASGSLDRTRPYLEEWKDAQGNFYTFSYGTDSSEPDYGQMRRVQSSNGGFLVFDYDVYGHIVEAYTGDGRRVRYDYDDYGDLTRVTLPDMSEINYEYSHQGNPTNNYALSGTATQSTTYVGAGDATAPKAIDGNTDGRWIPTYSVASTTSEANAWWKLDLGSIKSIGDIAIWNRTDAAPERLKNYWVLVCDTNIVSNNLTTARAQGGVSSYYQANTCGTATRIPANRTGRYVRVQLAGTEYLSIAEVQVFEASGFSTHLLTREIKPDGRILANNYDSLRRVTNQAATVGMDLNLVTNATFIYSNNFTNLTNSLITGTTKLLDVFGRTNTFDYTNNLITKITDPLNQFESQEWYSNTNDTGYFPRSLKFKTDKRGLRTDYKYDANGNATNMIVTGDLTGENNPSQTATTTFTFNTNNLPLEIVDPIGNKKTFVYSTTYPFLPEQVIQWAGATRVSTNLYAYYNPTSKVTNGTVVLTNQAFGLKQSETRAYTSTDVALTEWFHDGRGFITQQTNYSGTSDPNVITYFFYNDRGELVQQTDAAGRSTTLGYDGMGRPIAREVYETGQTQPVFWDYSYYNENGELTWSDGPRYNPEDYVWRDYDGGGRNTVEIHWRSQAKSDGTGVEAPPVESLYATTFRDYDKFNNLTRTIDPRGAITTNIWDSLGQLTQRKVLDTDGVTILTAEGFTYEAGGAISIHTNALGGLTKKFYTSAGQLRRQENPDNSTNGWTYYVDGRLRREYQRNGAYSETTYNDAAFSVTKIFYSSAGTSLATNVTELDRRGNLFRTVDASGNSFTNKFDGLNRIKWSAGPVIAFVVPDGVPLPGGPPPPVQQATTNYYDAAGIGTTNINALGEKKITYKDALGRVTRSEVRAANNTLVRESSTGYAADHHSMTVTNGSGASAIISTIYTDNDQRPILEVKYPQEGVREIRWHFYDLSGNPASDFEGANYYGSVSLNTGTDYVFDGMNRQRQKFVEGDGATTLFDYDASGNLTNRVMPGGLKWQATYNNAGQMTKSFDLSSSGATGTRTNSYSYFSSGGFAGLLQTSTDGRGVACAHSYDVFFRPETNSYSGSLPEHNVTTVLKYELRGLVTNITEAFASGGTGPNTMVRRSYDAYGLLTGDTVYVNGVIQSGGIQSWDSGGRRVLLGIENFGFSFGWKADGQLASVNAGSGHSAYTYSTAGLLNSRTVNAVSVNVDERDGTGRIYTRTTTLNASTVLGEGLSYYSTGLLAEHVVARLDFTDIRNYDYADYTQRLAEERLMIDGSKGWTNIFQYDNGANGGPGVLTRVSEPQTGGASWSASVDGFQRVEKETNNVIRRLAQGRMNAASQYGSVNLTLDSKPLPFYLLTSADTNWHSQWQAMMELRPGTHTLQATAIHSSGAFSTNKSVTFTNNAVDQTTVAYMSEGQVTTRIWKNAAGQTNRVETLNWDAKSRLLARSELDAGNNGYNWSAVYDPLGRRIRTTTIIVTNGVSLTNQPQVINQYYDPATEGLELGLRIDGKTVWKVHGPDLNGSYAGLNGRGGFEGIVDDLNIFHAAISDTRGNILAEHDPASGTLIWTASRPTAYGAVPEYRPVPLVKSGNLIAAMAWRGRWADISGDYNSKYRVYYPVGGYFLSHDFVVDPRDPTGFGFCGGDPLNWDDPNGLYGKRVGNYAYNGGSSGQMLRAVGGALESFASQTDSPLLGAVAEYYGTLANMGGSMSAPSTFVNQAMNDYEAGGYNNMYNRYNPARSPVEAVFGLNTMQGPGFGDRLSGVDRTVQTLNTVGLVAGTTSGFLKPGMPNVPPVINAATSVSTPYGPAFQAATSEAQALLKQMQTGGTVYKGGFLGRSEAGASQFLAAENPLNPGFAQRYGIPPQNANFDFVLTGKVQTGAPLITRPAPPVPPNLGGALEGVTTPGSFRIDSFYMP